MLEKTLESPLDCKEIQPVHPKENQSWMFIGRTDAEAEAPILGPPDAKRWHIGKDLDAGKDWRQEEKGMTGWDGWMASLTQWTWVWASLKRWWRIGKLGVLQSMGSQIVRHNWAAEQQQQIFIYMLMYMLPCCAFPSSRSLPLLPRPVCSLCLHLHSSSVFDSGPNPWPFVLSWYKAVYADSLKWYSN